MSEPAVAIEGVSKRFGRTLALDNVGFEVRRNELFALLGPNGAGKTTLGHILCTILRPDSGSDAEVVDHLIARPIVLTADHIELTIAALIDFHAGAHNPTAILVVDKNGWKLADEWKETRDPQEVGR